MSYETKGRELVAKANKKLKGWGLFGSKYEDAVELLDKAFNQFKLGKAWKEAAETCVQLTDVHAKLDSQHEVASCWVEAASCYKKISASGCGPEGCPRTLPQRPGDLSPQAPSRLSVFSFAQSFPGSPLPATLPHPHPGAVPAFRHFGPPPLCPFRRLRARIRLSSP